MPSPKAQPAVEVEDTDAVVSVMQAVPHEVPDPVEVPDFKQISARLPADLHDQLTQAALERELPVGRLVIQAIRDLLPRLIPADEWKLTR
jgi:hypothetical protein